MNVLKKINKNNMIYKFSAMLALFVMMFTYSSNNAFACHCEYVAATPEIITEGETTMLEWSFAVDNEGTTVTIDELPGEGWIGKTGTTEVSPTETTTYHIHVHRDGVSDVSCVVTVTVTHNSSEPNVPVCPFKESSDTIVIDFNSGKTREDASILCSNNCAHKEIEKTFSLSTGKYTIQTAAWDGYNGRENDPQPHEQFNVDIKNGDKILGSVGATTDLTDNVLEDTKINSFGKQLNISENANKIVLTHAFYPDNSSSNSVIPVCVAIKRVHSGSHNNPSCSITATPSKVNRGDEVTLSWTSKHTTEGVIDGGVGDVEPNGSKTIKVDESTIFIGTFKDDNGKKVTCSTKVRIKNAGGGSCMNCGHKDKTEKSTSTVEKKDKKTPPSIVLGKTTKKTKNSVTLDEVPYTGFEAGPLLTMAFWLTVLALSAAISYTLTVFQPLGRLKSVLASQKENNKNTETNIFNEVSKKEDSQIMASVQEVTDSPANFNLIEEKAHEESILLSPEALRMIEENLKKSELDAEEFLKNIFEKTKTMYPREDGWILLSKERANEIFSAETEIQHGMTEDNKPVRVQKPQISSGFESVESTIPTATTATVREETDQNEATNAVNGVVSTFVRNLVEVKKKEEFDLLRNITSKGVGISTFIGMVVRQLDDVYKHKIEGNHNPNKELIEITSSWNDKDFETVLGILVECIDYSYSNDRIGTKIALAKAFEYFERTK